MKTLRIFTLRNCPYCKQALSYIDELTETNEMYKGIKLEIIDEKEQKELADSYDYYYVPSFYYKEKKLSEGAVTMEKVQSLLNYVSEN